MTKEKLQIGVIVGSLRKESINIKLVKTIEKITQEYLEFDYIPIYNLPIYNEDLEKNIPYTVIELKSRIENTRNILFVTPEHNRSIPSALKNAIDWASRPWGQNSWKNKKAAIIGSSISMLGTCLAQNHLRSILLPLGVELMSAPELMLQCHSNIFSNESNLIIEEHTINFIKVWIDKYKDWLQS